MSIYAYAAGSAVLYGNGLAMLEPTVCTVHQRAAGVYELYMEHPITDDLKWKAISRGNLVKAPVPQAETPLIQMAMDQESESSKTRTIWRVRITTSKANGYSRIYQRANVNSKVLKRLRNGTEYEYLGAVGSNWHRAVASDGTTGYMYTANSVFVRNEAEKKPVATRPGFSSVVQPRQIREQYFRIYETNIDTASGIVSAYARHISYDFMGNMTKACNLENADIQEALTEIQGAMVNADDREIITDLSTTITEDYSYKNGIEILMDPDTGLIHKLEAKLVRDNEDFFLLKNDEVKRGVVISHGKNLLGVNLRENAENVVTRIVPIGSNSEGKDLLLPELYIDSPNIDLFPTINTQKLHVGDAKVSSDMTVDQAYEKMREAVLAEYEKGADKVDIVLDVNFVQLGDTEEYKQYKDLQHVFLYDTITIKHQPTGIETKAQVAEYEWDAILERYNRIVTGDVLEVSGSMIASYQLPNGGVSGAKLTPNTVDGSRLRDMSVTNAKIGTAAITYAKIASATIAMLNADTVKVVVAEIQKVTAGEITTNELYAQIVEAVALEVDKVTSGEITTNDLYAQIIKAFVLEIGKVTSGEIFTNELFSQLIQAVTAEFGRVDAETVATNALYTGLVSAIQADLGRVTADSVEASTLYGALVAATDIWAKTATIDIANIENSFTGNAVVQMGTAGKFYMSDLMVNDGNMVNLSAGNLMVKGEDGSWYQIIVSDDGVSATRAPVVVENQNVTDDSLSGEKIVENSINVSKLSADSLQANEAFLVSLVAGLAKFGSLTANEAMVQQLNTALIKANDALRIVIEQGPGMLEGLSKYFTFSDGLQISAEGSNFTSKWDEIMLGFYQSGKLVAYISNNALNADRIRANVSSEVGSWMWVSEDPQNLTLKWTGVT